MSIEGGGNRWVTNTTDYFKVKGTRSRAERRRRRRRLSGFPFPFLPNGKGVVAQQILSARMHAGLQELGHVGERNKYVIIMDLSNR